jgi:hypothetical protein
MKTFSQWLHVANCHRSWNNEPIFIRGIPPWEKNTPIGISPNTTISTSLHNKGLKPLRPYGYILKIHPGGIVAAFDTDVCSKSTHGEKCISQQTSHKKYRNYSEEELDELLTNTRPGYHNEIWVDSDKADIVGAYVTLPAPGWKKFQIAMQQNNIPITWLT